MNNLQDAIRREKIIEKMADLLEEINQLCDLINPALGHYHIVEAPPEATYNYKFTPGTLLLHNRVADYTSGKYRMFRKMLLGEIVIRCLPRKGEQ